MSELKAALITLSIIFVADLTKYVVARLRDKVDPEKLAGEIKAVKTAIDNNQQATDKEISGMRGYFQLIYTKEQVDEKLGRQQDKIDNVAEDMSEVKQDVKELRTLVITQHQEIMNAVNKR